MLDGGGGDDVLSGGLGVDTLTGGAGADVFQYMSIAHSGRGVGRDVVTDFEQGSDLIDLSRLNIGVFIGTAAFSGAAGELRYATFDGATILEADTNGDGRSDFQLEFDDSMELTIADFLGVETDATGPAAQGMFAPAGSASAAGDMHIYHSSGDQLMQNEMMIV